MTPHAPRVWQARDGWRAEVWRGEWPLIFGPYSREADARHVADRIARAFAVEASEAPPDSRPLPRQLPLPE
jgi:hypothetical protein